MGNGNFEVKRYDCGYRDDAEVDGFIGLKLKDDGELVAYADYAKLEEQLSISRRLHDAALKAEMTWEKTMMQVCGEDGPGSVAEKFAKLEAQVKALAAENAYLKTPLLHWNVEKLEMEYGTLPETPATDAYLAQLRNEAIPEGYVLVPQQIFLDPSDIESICSQCGNGAENEYGDYCDGLLWVGNIQDDAGNVTHGLHISSADYSDDGGITLHAFPDQLREGKAGEVQS